MKGKRDRNYSNVRISKLPKNTYLFKGIRRIKFQWLSFTLNLKKFPDNASFLSMIFFFRISLVLIPSNTGVEFLSLFSRFHSFIQRFYSYSNVSFFICAVTFEKKMIFFILFYSYKNIPTVLVFFSSRFYIVFLVIFSRRLCIFDEIIEKKFPARETLLLSKLYS